jgi:ERF superfamily
MNALVEMEDNVVPMSDAGSIMEVISRAAADPATDVDKLERLLGMYERITARSAQAEFTAALAELQPKLPVIGHKGEILNKAGNVVSTYARWEDINDAIRPVLAEHGFALSFKIGRTDDGRPSVTGVLSHRAGHREETTMVLPVDDSGFKNAIQSVGSSVSYGKRYTTLALLNITSRGEDDDGQAASREPISEKQRDQILALIEANGFSVRRFCRYFKIQAVADLPAKDFKRALRELQAEAAEQ